MLRLLAGANQLTLGTGDLRNDFVLINVAPVLFPQEEFASGSRCQYNVRVTVSMTNQSVNWIQP
jgi:hypothetical protein